MRAAIGDKIVVRGRAANESRREGVILAVEGEDGQPPYLVRWDDTGHEMILFPDFDTFVEPAAAAAGR